MTTLNGYENQNDATDATAHHFVFVYGTLMAGFSNHAVLIRGGWSRNVATRAHTTAAAFAMEDWGFPAAFDDASGTTLIGEVYEVDAECLASMDLLESHPGWYRRRLIEITLDAPILPDAKNGGTLKAWVYLMKADARGRGGEIADCDFRTFKAAAPNFDFGDDDDDTDDGPYADPGWFAAPSYADDPIPAPARRKARPAPITPDEDGDLFSDIEDDQAIEEYLGDIGEGDGADEDYGPDEIGLEPPGVGRPADPRPTQRSWRAIVGKARRPALTLALAAAAILGGLTACAANPDIHGRYVPAGQEGWRAAQRQRQATVEGYPTLWRAIQQGAD